MANWRADSLDGEEVSALLVRWLTNLRATPLKMGRLSRDGLIDCTNAVEKWRKVATASTISGGIVTLQSCSQ
jgi:hypothetical protein